MNVITRLLPVVLFFCSALADMMVLYRETRGTRGYRDQCMDVESTAVRELGQTWLRWRGQKVEYCRCAIRGRVRCHYIPITTCYMSRCYNGGTCKEAVYSNDFICLCPPEFTGNQCEINLNEKCVSGKGSGYRGTWSISSSGAECINWNSTALRGKKFTARKSDAGILGLGNHNYCRNPDGDSRPWCYVYKRSQLAWEFCSMPNCTVPAAECVQGSGQSYRGTQSVSKSGAKCLPWDSPAIYNKIYTAWRSDARELGLGSHSHCRNPDGDLGPWCHVYKGTQVTWERCDIPQCLRKPSTITTLGPRAPTSTSNKGSCGQRSSKPSTLPMFRIIGGQVSDIKEQPWQAAITVYWPRSKSHNFLCGGVLIDSCFVLSAAHCFQEGFTENRLRVILGRTFRLQNSSSEQIFEVEKYWIHKQYKDESYDNDIALLKLKSENGICAVNSPEVLPICLPDPKIVLPDWMECEISGYGKAEEFSPFFSERVKRGHVRLWPQELCVPERLSGREVTPNMLCAGDTRGLDDACKGDSGGPLVCEKDNRMTLIGLISWGDGCGKKDKPGVYTRVSKYTSWIYNVTRSN